MVSIPYIARCPIVASLCCLIWAHLNDAIVHGQSNVPSDVDATDKAFVLAQETYKGTVLPILRNSCFDCHSDEAGEAGLDFSRYSNVQQIIDARQTWKTIGEVTRNHQMPPADVSELSTDDRKILIGFVDNLLYELDCNSQAIPGEVTLRRLSRYEYSNTVRDWLGVEYSASETFPADEVGYGFDNIGDVLSISPLHLEKYLDAAETISRQAIFDTRQVKHQVMFDGAEFGEVEGAYDDGPDRVLTTNGAITLRHQFRLAGKYKIVIRAFEDPGGPDRPKMGVGLNGLEVREFTVKGRKRKPANYETEFEIPQGQQRIFVSFKNDYYDPDFPVRSRRDRNLGVRSVRIVGPLGFKDEDLPYYARHLTELIRDKKIDANAAKYPQALNKLLNRMASFAYRRPATSAEIDRLKRLFETAQQESPDVFNSMQVVLQSLLVSPKFLFRIEQPVTSGTVRRLSEFELATALSYFLWSSMPDERLIRLAAKGELSDEKTLRSEIQRMLADQKANALVENFAVQWFQLRILESIDPDPELFGEFNEHLRRSMIGETKKLFLEIIRHDLPITHLLSSPYSFLNRSLGEHYGLPASIVDELPHEGFQRVDMESVGRRGLLGQASFLTLTSNPTRTSPVKRGKWVLENLLSQPPPPALPDVPALDNQAELTGTLRERMAQHAADPSCAVCHDQLDPIGFALEKFDAIGRFRELDAGKPIDDSGVMPDGRSFNGATELLEILVTKKKEHFLRCSVEKLMTYALGRGLEGYDDCTVKQITDAAMAGNDSFSDIIEGIVLSEAFLKRGSAAHADGDNDE